jgi:16S rRNA (guanine527-N7)-methyltransferase
MDTKFTTRKPLIDLFVSRNSRLNLSAIRDEQGIYTKHILDSLALTSLGLIKDGMTVCDVGTGGGFPLLPLAMWYPRTYFVGLDSVSKKLKAIEDMAQTLHIMNVKTVWARSEAHYTKYDIVVARAVSYISTFLELSAHLIKPGGLLVLYKEYKKAEYDEMMLVLPRYGLKLIKTHEYQVMSGDIERRLYVIKKV